MRWALGLAVALFTHCMLLGSSYADWQYTRWGMSVDDVIVASGGIAKPNSNVARESTKNLRTLLKAPYQTGKFKFNVAFMFDTWSKKLVRVNLVLLAPSLGSELGNALKSKYGPPILDSSRAANWRDEENGNNIAWYRIGSLLSGVQYWAISGHEGL